MTQQKQFENLLGKINPYILESYKGTITDSEAQEQLLEHCHQLHELTKDEYIIYFIRSVDGEPGILDILLFDSKELETEETLEEIFEHIPGSDIIKLDLNEALISYLE